MEKGLTSWICFFSMGSCFAAFCASLRACFAWNCPGLALSRPGDRPSFSQHRRTYPRLELHLHIPRHLLVRHGGGS